MPMNLRLDRIFRGWEAWSLLPARIAAAIVFVFAGASKLLGMGFSGFADLLAKEGIEPAMFWSVVVILVESLGGIALLLGLLTRWAAFLLAVNMAVALLAVTLPMGFQASIPPLAMLGICLTLVLAGAGEPSIDQRLPGWLTGDPRRGH